MVSVLNMSHENITNFVSLPLFRFNSVKTDKFRFCRSLSNFISFDKKNDVDLIMSCGTVSDLV